MANVKALNKDPFTYAEERRRFLEDLQRFHTSRGTPFDRIPQVGGREIDLYRLYRNVTKLGGWQKVNTDLLWDDIQEEFRVPISCGNGAQALKFIYFRYLNLYERAHFLGLDPDSTSDEPEDGPVRKKICLPVELIPLSYNYNQHKIQENTREANNLSFDLARFGDYDKLEMALRSGLPNEVDFAVNVCLLLSNEGRYVLKLNRSIHLMTLLLANVGIFEDGLGTMEDVLIDCWRKPDCKRDFLRFWHDVVKDEKIREYITTKDGVYKRDEMVGSEVLHLGRDLGVRDAEGQRVLQLAMLIRNLSFEEVNQQVLGSSVLIFRFLMLCVHSSYGSLRQLALDTLGNLAAQMVLRPVDAAPTLLIVNLVQKSLMDDDKFVIVRALEMLGKLCQLERNEVVLTEKLEEETYRRIVQLLTVHDIQLIVHTLEALYQLSELGETSTNMIAGIKQAVDMLVNLITVEAQSYGPDSLIGIKVVEYVPATDPNAAPSSTPIYPPSRTVIQSIAPKNAPGFAVPPSPQMSAADQAKSDVETTASNWLQGTYETKKGSTIKQADLFADYQQFCCKFGIADTLAAADLVNIVKSAIPQAKISEVDRGGGQKEGLVKGLSKRAKPKPFAILAGSDKGATSAGAPPSGRGKGQSTPKSGGKKRAMASAPPTQPSGPGPGPTGQSGPPSGPVLLPPRPPLLAQQLQVAGAPQTAASVLQSNMGEQLLIQTTASPLLKPACPLPAPLVPNCMGSPPLNISSPSLTSASMSPGQHYPTIHQALQGDAVAGTGRVSAGDQANDTGLIKSLLAKKVCQNMVRQSNATPPPPHESHPDSNQPAQLHQPAPIMNPSLSHPPVAHHDHQFIPPSAVQHHLQSSVAQHHVSKAAGQHIVHAPALQSQLQGSVAIQPIQPHLRHQVAASQVAQPQQQQHNTPPQMMPVQSSQLAQQPPNGQSPTQLPEMNPAQRIQLQQTTNLQVHPPSQHPLVPSSVHQALGHQHPGQLIQGQPMRAPTQCQQPGAVASPMNQLPTTCQVTSSCSLPLPTTLVQTTAGVPQPAPSLANPHQTSVPTVVAGSSAIQGSTSSEEARTVRGPLENGDMSEPQTVTVQSGGGSHPSVCNTPSQTAGSAVSDGRTLTQGITPSISTASAVHTHWSAGPPLCRAPSVPLSCSSSSTHLPHPATSSSSPVSPIHTSSCTQSMVTSSCTSVTQANLSGQEAHKAGSIPPHSKFSTESHPHLTKDNGLVNGGSVTKRECNGLVVNGGLASPDSASNDLPPSPVERSRGQEHTPNGLLEGSGSSLKEGGQLSKDMLCMAEKMGKMNGVVHHLENGDVKMNTTQKMDGDQHSPLTAAGDGVRLNTNKKQGVWQVNGLGSHNVSPTKENHVAPQSVASPHTRAGPVFVKQTSMEEVSLDSTDSRLVVNCSKVGDMVVRPMFSPNSSHDSDLSCDSFASSLADSVSSDKHSNQGPHFFFRTSSASTAPSPSPSSSSSSLFPEVPQGFAGAFSKPEANKRSRKKATPKPKAEKPPPKPRKRKGGKNAVPDSPTPPVPAVPLVMEYMCEWSGCGRCFDNARLVFIHAAKTHIPAAPEAVCHWHTCEPLRRKRWSLVTHVQDHHCSEMAQRAACQRRFQAAQTATATAPQPPTPLQQAPALVYPMDAAMQAIKRFHIKPPFVEFADPREGPVTKHIRLTAALILRNLSRYSTLGRRLIKLRERQLSYVTMSACESSTALSSCLWEILHDT